MSDTETLAAYKKALKTHGSQRAAALAIGVPRSTIQEMLKRGQTVSDGVKLPPAPTFLSKSAIKPTAITTKIGETKTLILTAAQDDSAVHEGFLKNLEAYASYLGAEIMVAGFTYNKSLFEDHAARTGWYHPSIQKYLVHQSYVINDSLLFCGEMNTQPTAVSPLTGFEVYTRHRSGIFPHAKVQLESIPTMQGFPPKINMTTGAVTLPNYVQKRAGIIATFHHVIGAVIVEVDGEGDWFARHLIAEDDGAFQDLDVVVANGVVDTGYNVEAINWGDLHFPNTDLLVSLHGWGWPDTVPEETMLDELQPRVQFLHDTSDFADRNHHNIADPYHAFKVMQEKGGDLRKTFVDMSSFVESFRREFSEVVVVESNHDLAFRRWLRDSDWRTDPLNAELYLEANLRLLQSIKQDEDEFSLLKWVLEREGVADLNDVLFLKEDQSYRICEKAGDTGIECGMHGHLGANGSKGTPRQFTRMGPKANTGHTHSCGIRDGIYTAGTSSLLNMGYNKGLSSWSHSHIVTYPNGKRTIVTMKNGKWRG